MSGHLCKILAIWNVELKIWLNTLEDLIIIDNFGSNMLSLFLLFFKM